MTYAHRASCATGDSVASIFSFWFRGWFSPMTTTLPKSAVEETPVVSIRNMAFDSREACQRMTQGRVRRWWLRRRGWIFYGGDGDRA